MGKNRKTEEGEGEGGEGGRERGREEGEKYNLLRDKEVNSMEALR